MIPLAKIGFAENLTDGQLVIKTMLTREWKELEESGEVSHMGGELGYWLFKWHSGLREFEPIAKFISRHLIDDFVSGLDLQIIYWPEDD